MSLVETEIDLIVALDENDNCINAIESYYTKFGLDDTLSNILFSFFNDRFDSPGFKLYFLHLKSGDSTEPTIKKIFDLWSDNLNENDATLIFSKLISQLNEFDKKKDKLFIRNVYKGLLFNSVFREGFNLHDKKINGSEFETCGIFSPLFERKKTKFTSSHLNNFNSIDVYELVEIIRPILDDISIRDSLIIYIDRILCANQEYTREDTHYIDVQKLSSVSFNKFLLIILLELYSKINIDDVEYNEQIVITDYEIENVNLNLEQKIIVTLAKAIPICHVSSIKLYHATTRKKIFATPQQLEIINNRLSALSSIFSSEKSNFAIQNFYVDYYRKIYPNLSIQTAIADIALFTDLITSFPPNKNIYGFVQPKIFHICSEILGDSTVTEHSKHYCAEVLFKLIPTHGFNIAPTFFNDLFKYIGETNYYKWMNLLQAIRHHKKILQNMIMLIDYPEKVFAQSDKIVSKTLYTLLGDAIESYTQFESICKQADTIQMTQQVAEVMNDFCDIIMMTLNIYTNIYTQAIVKKSYSETEGKYSILVYKLIETCVNDASAINTYFKNNHVVKQLLDMTFESLYSHIDIAAQYLSQYRDVIMGGLDKSTSLTNEEKNKIKLTLDAHNKPEIKYPDEFLDPLLCIPIEEPIMLPGIDEIHDRTTIVSQIHESGQNPYNRKPLSLEELEEYNKTQEVMDLINNFKKRKAEFEQTYNK